MKKELEVNVSRWYATLKPQDAKNVRKLIPVVKSRIKRHTAIFAAVGSSVRKAREEKKRYGDIDLAMVLEYSKPRNAYESSEWFKALAKDIGSRLGWSFFDSRCNLHSFRSNYPALARYALHDSIHHRDGNFTGYRISLCPEDYYSSRDPSWIDLMLVSGSKFGNREYGDSVDDWLKGQKEQELPYVVLARF